MDADRLEPGRDRPSVLVVGVDGSDTSWRALYYAFGLARRQHSTVTAVFAVTTGAGFVATMLVPGHFSIEVADRLKPTIEALAADYDVPTRFVSVEGDPVAVLTRIAAAQHADALILGASRALGHRRFGSIALRVVRRSARPVTVVP